MLKTSDLRERPACRLLISYIFEVMMTLCKLDFLSDQSLDAKQSITQAKFRILKRGLHRQASDYT